MFSGVKQKVLSVQETVRESQRVIEILSKLTIEDAEEFKKDMEEEMKNVSIGLGDFIVE